ncbi:hypothetical protein E3V39_13180 [Gammaproteobacteria bacterium LSUCC0112]|nr:hypothetical protein E3V39_13180 [Gammaproteobacteria bacterium LSUCC0112]
MSDSHSVQRDGGSILLVCMVFLAALSITALTAVEVSLIGQKMVFAYARHNTAFIEAENQLLETEQYVWWQLESTGLAATAKFWSAERVADSAGRPVVAFSAQWAQTEFTHVQCGVLFSAISNPDSQPSSSMLRPGVDWWVCCETSQLCEQAQFLATRRGWRRDPHQQD